MNATCELQQLYDSGVRFTLQPDRGRGFLVSHGDYLREAGNTAVLPTFDQAVRWLSEQVRFRYPDSDYAKRAQANSSGDLTASVHS